MTGDLTAVADVLAAVERAVHPTPPVEVLLDRCWRGVLTRDVAARVALPPHDNSAMDGFAVRSEDTDGAAPDTPVTLRVVGRSFAGAPPAVPCAPGDTVEIATGAMLPAGADAVVRIEEVSRNGETIELSAAVPRGRDVRWRGEDIGEGEKLLAAGQILGVTQLAAAAAAGHRSLPIHRPATVTVVLTGDELARGAALDPGQVPDALGPALAAAIRADGASATVTGPIGDDDDRLSATLTAVASTSDLVVTVGGVSVGPRDRVPVVLGRLGSVRRWQVAVRPGKPFALSQVDDTPVVSLPGNPVAALVAHELFVRAALGQLAGRPYRPRPSRARLTAPVGGAADRLHVLRGKLGEDAGELTVSPLGERGAGRIASIAAADAWILVEPGAGELEAGAQVTVRTMAGA